MTSRDIITKHKAGYHQIMRMLSKYNYSQNANIGITPDQTTVYAEFYHG